MEKSNSTHWEKLRLLKDSEIDYSDIPDSEEEFWADAEAVYPQKKVSVRLKIDADIAEWLKKMGEDSDSAVNSLLRSYYLGVKYLPEKKP
jgi:uncharacterized protein (DUF4415 family)